jgi:hypothetical protein
VEVENIWLGCAKHGKIEKVTGSRDDKKERVVEGERAVAKGEGSCWGGRGRHFLPATALFIDCNRLCAKVKKSQALGKGESCGLDVQA